jgi:hypothetical protein
LFATHKKSMNLSKTILLILKIYLKYTTYSTVNQQYKVPQEHIS